jgi:hypothetical protein
MKIKTERRDYSLITGENNLELLCNLENFPVFIGCTSSPSKEDIFADMTWMICRDSGMIQLRDMLPLDIVYSGYHSEALGETWLQHHSAFCDFVRSYSKGDILEIGGGNGALAIQYTESSSQRWTIIEPTPSSFRGNEKISIIQGFFDENTQLENINTIVHSHVIEHINDPNVLLKSIHKYGRRQIFSIPNLEWYLRERYSNAINFEHTYFLTESMMDFLLQKNGFVVLEKRHFKNHSIFYATEKTCIKSVPLFPDKYAEYSQLYIDMLSYYRNEVERLNKLMKMNNGIFYLFGAHIFSQFLIYLGLDGSNINCILDNSELKQGKRLYGTNLFVKSPNILKEQNNARVILKAGQYQKEVRNQLSAINQGVIILE